MKVLLVGELEGRFGFLGRLMMISGTDGWIMMMTMFSEVS
jgi:hypothetical protein